jgi:hypothetical protein
MCLKECLSEPSRQRLRFCTRWAKFEDSDKNHHLIELLLGVCAWCLGADVQLISQDADNLLDLVVSRQHVGADE